MANLKDFGFTHRADRAHSADGWYLGDFETVLTLDGNDVISTSGSIAWNGILISSQAEIHTGRGDDVIHAKSEGNAIINDGTISTDEGRDQIIGDVSQNAYSGSGIDNRGTILTGSDNDSITGIGGGYGIYNNRDAWINTGAGNDTINGSGKWGGLINYGTIYTSLGNDAIHAKGVILNTHIIDTHTGDDLVRATGTLLNDRVGESPDPLTDKAGIISLGDGNDQLHAQDGLRNEGLIDTGRGNDIITLAGSSGIQNDPGFFPNSVAGRIKTGEGNDQFINNLADPYRNDGIIDLGPGADTMDTLNQGFTGRGSIDLGSGNDTWKGFSSGHNTSNPYRGGSGTDTLVFKPGTYSVVRQSANQYLIGGSMSVIGFERFGSAAGFLTLSAAAASGSVTFNL